MTDQHLVYIETYGCQMNVLDSELIKNSLVEQGYAITEQEGLAQTVLLNTCSVRDLSEQKVWSKLGRLRELKAHKGVVLGVLGCMAERCAAELEQRAPYIDIICGPSKLWQLPQLLTNVLSNRDVATPQIGISGFNQLARSRLVVSPQNEAALEQLDLSRHHQAGAAQAYVRITRGCNKFCAFCVVPYTRGAEQHRLASSIIQEVQTLVANGVKEITLLGQTVNHYFCYENGQLISFADLLYRIHTQVPQLPRLRFVTSYPRDFTDEALAVMQSCPRICRYLHIPAQSGSNSVLKRMNRGYSVELYLDLVTRARARMPDIALSGDMIVGFSGETIDDHHASRQLLSAVRYKNCFVFKYSPRSNTSSFKRLPDDVSVEDKEWRNQDLLQLQNQLSLQHHQQLIGQTRQVLVERISRIKSRPPSSGQMSPLSYSTAANEQGQRWLGRTALDEIVAFDGPADLLGKLVDVQITRCTPLTAFGHYVAPSAQITLAAAG